MRYSREFIDKVIAASQLADIVSQYTVLKPAGRDLVGRCPFPDHNEKSPSFHVSPDKQVYHCFGCKKGGNIFTFLEQFQGMNFPEAIEYLAQKASIPIPIQENISPSHEQKESLRRKQMLEINRVVADYYSMNLKKLPTSHFVRDYVQKRNLKAETIQQFQIGYASDDWEGLVRHLRSQGLSLALAEELGLVKRRDSGGYYDLFRDRLMFTITNQMGEVIGFGGRILGEGQPKYINSPESPLFHKGRSLYGLHHSSRHIRSQDQVIIVEGYMDLIALFQAGIQNVVAPLGTALTLEQCRLLARMTKNAVILFDGDSAGQAAAERSLPLLFEAGMYPKGLTLPDEQDPDEFLEAHGLEKMTESLLKANDLFTLVVRRWMEGFQGSPTDKVRMVQRIRPLLLSIKDASLKTLYIRELARRLGVELSWMQRAILEGQSATTTTMGRSAPKEQAVSGMSSSGQGPSQASGAHSPSFSPLSVDGNVGPHKISLMGAPKWELLILALGLNSPSVLWDRILHAEETGLLTHGGVREVFERAKSLTGQSGLPSDNFFALIANEISNPDLLTAVIRDLPTEDKDKEAKLLMDCFRKVRIGDLDRRIKALAQELKIDARQEKWEQLASLQKDRLRWLNLNP